MDCKQNNRCIPLLMKSYTVNDLRFQILSDIHLEARGDTIPQITPSASNLILAGDIGYPSSAIYKKFLDWASSNYDLVFLVAGNHEYWSKTLPLDRTIALLERMCADYSNVVFLEQETVIIEYEERKIRVFGATLWSDLEKYPEIKYLISDYKRITMTLRPPSTKRGPITTKYVTTIHQQTVAMLEKLLEDPMPLLVITHHLPSFLCTPFRDRYTPAYATNLEGMLKVPIVMWVCGHSHHSMDTTIQGIRVVSNQMGYPLEKDEGYKDGMVVEL